jgi:hypothetical protein
VLNLRNLARAVVAAVVTGAAVFVSALPAGAADGAVGGADRSSFRSARICR